MSCSHTDEYAGNVFPTSDLTVRLGEGEVLLFQGVEGPYSARIVHNLFLLENVYCIWHFLNLENKRKKK